MNLLAYAIYLVLTYAITVHVGHSFYTNGRIYILGMLQNDHALTDQVNSGNQYAGLVEEHASSARFNGSGDAHAQVLPARFMASARPWTVGNHAGFAAHVPGRGGFGFGS